MKISPLMIRIFALPTALAGLMMIYDILIAPGEHDTASVTNKYLSSSKGTDYDLEVSGRQVYLKNVPRHFYDLCSINDTVELSVSPIFKEWHRIALIRGGKVVTETTPTDIYFMSGFAFAFLLPCLSFLPWIANTFDSFSLVDKKQQNKNFFWIIIFLLELGGIIICIKLADYFMGLVNSV